MKDFLGSVTIPLLIHISNLQCVLQWSFPSNLKGIMKWGFQSSLEKYPVAWLWL